MVFVAIPDFSGKVLISVTSFMVYAWSPNQNRIGLHITHQWGQSVLMELKLPCIIKYKVFCDCIIHDSFIDIISFSSKYTVVYKL